MKKEFLKKGDFKKNILISSAIAASLLSVGHTAQAVKAESTSPSQTDQQAQAYNWTLKGLADAKFATVEINGGNLNVVGTGSAPHVYWKNKVYASVKVIRNDKVIYEKDFIGDKGIKFDENFTLKAGDKIAIYHAEPTRLTSSIKFRSSFSVSTFYYEYTGAGEVTNQTNFENLQAQINTLFTSDKDDELSASATKAKISAINLNFILSTGLTAEQKSIIKQRIATANRLFDEAASSTSIKENQVQSKSFYVLPVQSDSNVEGRQMGTSQDRQPIGLILTKGSSLKVRQANTAYKGNVSVELIGSSSAGIKTTSVGNDWVELTANREDCVVVLKTLQSNNTSIEPKLEYELVSGTAPALPTFTATSNQADVLKQWQTTKTAFALIEANNIDILVPLSDYNLVAKTNIKQLINQYDNQVFKLYNYLTGYDYNDSPDKKVKAKYFVIADQTGAGAGYYSGNLTAQTGKSVSAYLSINWLPLHEVAHGYEVPSDGLWIRDSFNNIFGTLYQLEYEKDNFEKKSWLLYGQKFASVSDFIKQVKSGKDFNGLNFFGRLHFWMNLAYNLEGMDGFRNFNIYHKEAAKKGLKVSYIPDDWVRVYKDNYNLNIAPYWHTINEKIDTTLESNVYNLPAVAMIYQVVPDDLIDSATKVNTLISKLGLTDNLLASQGMLVTNQTLAKAGLTSDITLRIADSNFDAINGSTLYVKDGNQVIKTVKVDSQLVSLGSIANGIYTFRSSVDGLNFVNKYLYVKDSGIVDEIIDPESIGKKASTEVSQSESSVKSAETSSESLSEDDSALEPYPSSASASSSRTSSEASASEPSSSSSDEPSTSASNSSSSNEPSTSASGSSSSSESSASASASSSSTSSEASASASASSSSTSSEASASASSSSSSDEPSTSASNSSSSNEPSTSA
ncbi:putative mucin/carbohydrate-binding domain-containing protein, partial [Lactobacillus mulieris]